MKKLLCILSFFILLSACNGGGKIPTDQMGIPTICGCGTGPGIAPEGSTNTGLSQEEMDKAAK